MTRTPSPGTSVRFRSPRDAALGLVLVVIASLAMIAMRHLRFGSLQQMEAGFLPITTAFLLLVIGVMKIVQGYLVDGEPIEGERIIPLLSTLAGISVFALMIERLGLPISVIALVVVCSIGIEGANIRQALLLAVLLAAGCVGLFIYALRLPFGIFPW
jgi:putative tricarboxylic transport membrane protein